MGGVFVASPRGVEEEEEALASQDMCMRYRTDLSPIVSIKHRGYFHQIISLL